METIEEDMVTRLIVGLAGAWMLGAGGLWNGFLAPNVFEASRGLLGLLLMGWLFWRTWQRWTWRPSALDLSAASWTAASAINVLAHPNPLAAVPLWWGGVALALYTMLHDALSNRALTVNVLIDGLLLASIPTLIRGGLDVVGQGVRISAGLENPNYAATLFAVLIPLALRQRWTVYTALCGALMIATFSRGAPLALAAGGGLAALALGRRLPRRWIVAGAMLGLLLIVIVRLRGGDPFTGREVYWADAIQRFADAPLVGEGLMSYRHPDYVGPQMHMHPHSFPLLIAAEMGLPGVAALGVLGWQVGRPAWQRRDLWLIAALGAWGSFQVVDFTAQQPAVMLLGVVLVACVSFDHRPYISRRLAVALRGVSPVCR
jgi:hypothetical protein